MTLTPSHALALVVLMSISAASVGLLVLAWRMRRLSERLLKMECEQRAELGAFRKTLMEVIVRCNAAGLPTMLEVSRGAKPSRPIRKEPFDA